MCAEGRGDATGVPQLHEDLPALRVHGLGHRLPRRRRAGGREHALDQGASPGAGAEAGQGGGESRSGAETWRLHVGVEESGVSGWRDPG